MEFILNTDLDKALPTVIDFNFKELKAELSTKLMRYKGAVVTQDGIAAAKADKATLNRLRTAIEDRRKDVKKQCLAPYIEFEVKCKDIVSMIDEPIEAIDCQLRQFEEQRKSEKLTALKEYFETKVGALAALVAFEKIFNPKWLNATARWEQVCADVDDVISKIEAEIKTIKLMDCENRDKVLVAYLQDFNLNEALAEKTRLEEQQKRIEEFEKNTEAKPTAQSVLNVKPPSGDLDESEKLKTISVVFYDTTQSFRDEMRALTVKHNIAYGGIK
ncbi:MAG: DUF1351 domain-containing protein [Oscillospiraceae bacterium]